MCFDASFYPACHQSYLMKRRLKRRRKPVSFTLTYFFNSLTTEAVKLVWSMKRFYLVVRGRVSLSMRLLASRNIPKDSARHCQENKSCQNIFTNIAHIFFLSKYWCQVHFFFRRVDVFFTSEPSYRVTLHLAKDLNSFRCQARFF